MKLTQQKTFNMSQGVSSDADTGHTCTYVFVLHYIHMTGALLLKETNQSITCNTILTPK